MAASFVPRAAFPALQSLPRSYFLGHHRAGLKEMRKVLASIDLVIECRDYRVPITSRNPLLEEAMADSKERLILYTKHDLGGDDRARDRVIKRWHAPTAVLFSDFRSARSVQAVLRFAQERAAAADSLTGARMMVAGMPNVGKSSLLNALRAAGVGGGKAAQTGAQPGVTRRLGNEVRVAGDPKAGDALYLVDTPGVFVPYVPDAQAMLKLALCGCVKDTIVPPDILADYLLFRLNLEDPHLYGQYCEPTNDVMELLEATARKTGRLQKGAVPDTEASAICLIQRWRAGHLGRFVLDEVDESSLERKMLEEQDAVGSVSQARKAAREEARQLRLKRASTTS